MKRTSLLSMPFAALLVLCPATAASGMYHPTLGRWTTRDPIGYEGDGNLCSYVGGQPIGSTDPSGLKQILKWSAEGWGYVPGEGLVRDSLQKMVGNFKVSEFTVTWDVPVSFDDRDISGPGEVSLGKPSGLSPLGAMADLEMTRSFNGPYNNPLGSGKCVEMRAQIIETRHAVSGLIEYYSNILSVANMIYGIRTQPRFKPKSNRWHDPQTGRFVPRPDTELDPEPPEIVEPKQPPDFVWEIYAKVCTVCRNALGEPVGPGSRVYDRGFGLWRLEGEQRYSGRSKGGLTFSGLSIPSKSKRTGSEGPLSMDFRTWKE